MDQRSDAELALDEAAQAAAAEAREHLSELGIDATVRAWSMVTHDSRTPAYDAVSGGVVDYHRHGDRYIAVCTQAIDAAGMPIPQWRALRIVVPTIV